MLETRNLVKIYKPKKGVPVTALNRVSIKFPDKGMVFLLGKSGSGKSTLLNVLGGLDRYNAGEILIKGKSSGKFKQKDFDSYRNTYVGFIFQEYNILDEFSVGANIALALQLQGINPTSEHINNILKQVDLEGFGNRKPNELSGGQKQRVAIARALVKNPQIIMADEPTGALDSNTGRQILTTLKKLSAGKLVIVVSHDREFAEQYADRIIELADGSVIRDVERVGDSLPEITAPVYEDDGVCLPRDYVLTEADNQAICAYIQNMVSQGKAPRFSLGRGEDNRGFQPTDPSKIQSSTEGYRLIKSRLPLQYAFKLGSSGLKHKRFRLIMTILLSCISFVLLGLSDTFAAYDYVDTAVSSLANPDSQVSYASFRKMMGSSQFSDGSWNLSPEEMTQADISNIEKECGISTYPVYAWKDYSDFMLPLTKLHLENDIFEIYGGYNSSFYSLYGEYYARGFAGYVEITEDLMKQMNAKLVAGKLPTGTDELAISTYILETFYKYNYFDGTQRAVIRNPEDICGKTVTIDGIDYTVTGVVETDIDLSRYESLKDFSLSSDESDYLLRLALMQELESYCNYSLAGLAMVSPGQIQRIVDYKGQENNNIHVSIDPETGGGSFIIAGDDDSYGDSNGDSYIDFSFEGFDIISGMELAICQTLSPMPKNQSDIRRLVEFGKSEFTAGKVPYNYQLQNPVSYELRGLDEIFEVFRVIFFYISIIFMVFASLLFSNFISTSISYKKREIGILRAIGSRSNDVFRIFFAESFIIAMINFVLSLTGTIALCSFINYLIRHEMGLLLTVLNVGIRQILLLFGICLLLAAAASFLPVRKIAAKRPIDAIRDR